MKPGDVHRFDFSPDGRLIAAAGTDGVAKLLDARTGATVHVLRGHEESVTAVAFSDDGRLLATASTDHDARIWDVASGRPTELLQVTSDRCWARPSTPRPLGRDRRARERGGLGRGERTSRRLPPRRHRSVDRRIVQPRRFAHPHREPGRHGSHLFLRCVRRVRPARLDASTLQAGFSWSASAHPQHRHSLAVWPAVGSPSQLEMPGGSPTRWTSRRPLSVGVCFEPPIINLPRSISKIPPRFRPLVLIVSALGPICVA